MPISVVCPGCSAKLNAPDAAAGKKLKCPRCQGAITVPNAVGEAEIDVADDEPVQPASKPVPKPEADEDEKPKKNPVRAAAEEDEEEEVAKPNKKRPTREDDEDEGDERPRKKKKKAGASMTRNVIGGVVLVIVLVVLAFVYWDKFGGKEKETASNTNGGDAAPAGSPGPKRPEGGTKDPDGTPSPPSAAPKDRLGAARVGKPVLSADGARVLARHVVDRGLQLSVWDVTTGAPVVSIGTGTSPQPDAYGLSPDKKQVAVVSHREKKLTLWSTGGKLEKTIDLPPWKDATRMPAFATYTPDGTAILIAYEGQLLRVETQTGATQVLLKDVDTLNLRYVPEANAVVESGYNQTSSKTELRVIDLTRPSAPKVMALKGDENPEGCPDLSADGKTVVAFVMDRTDFEKPTKAIHLYDATTGQLKGKISAQVSAPDFSVGAGEVRISPDGRRVCFSGEVVKGGKRSHGCWVSDATGKNVRQLGEPGTATVQITRFAADNKTIVVHAGAMRVYDAESAKDVTP